MIAGVYVNIDEASIDKPYDYFVPPSFEARIARGTRVVVPFGKGNKKLEGVVVSVRDLKPSKRLKPISYLPEWESVGEYELSLAHFMSDRYFCTFFDALKVQQKPGSYTRFFERIYINRDADLSCCDESDLELYLYVGEHEGIMLSALETSYKNRKKSIASLIERGILRAELKLEKGASDHTVKYAEAAADASQKIKKANHKKAYDILAAEGAMSLKELSYAAGISKSVIDTMKKNGYINVYDAPESRSFYKDFTPRREEEIVLTPEQKKAYDKLKELFDENRPNAALIYGVTGSGKTQVYIKIIEHVINAGRTALVLLPEIGLSPQVFGMFRSRFGDIVGLMHSKMSQGERHDEYMRIKRGEVKIVIGTRMAVFSNLENLGVIIIDEEQEHTYVSEMPPKYHAADIAKYRCKLDNALFVLGSATPSLESYYYAKTGRYHLIKLTERYGGTKLPEVKLADMMEELTRGNSAEMSAALLSELSENLKRGEQSILYLNRRGYSTLVSCPKCGYVHKCKNCSVPLKYHKKNDRVICHICGYSEDTPKKCPECNNDMIAFSGAGTQKVEDQLSELLPGARVIRMDADTTMGRRAHDEMLRKFAAGEADILVGTQMVTKGLDFDRVTLVGVLNADAPMYSDDFRGAERTFSQITQVIGRAGRREIRGRAVIQTFSPHSQIMAHCMKGDYEEFFESEIELRRALIYPPFCDLARLTVSSALEETANDMVRLLDTIIKRKLSQNNEIRVIILGPAPPSVLKANNKYRMRIILKCRSTKKFREFLREVYIAFSREKKGAKASLNIEINPANI
ncbi:MAG: primosomal protein N' [Clostridia bacterium]|nr:primosomal protein N' [Clostridia bacterium]